MELILRAFAGPGIGDDAVVEADPDHTVADLGQALAHHLGPGVGSGVVSNLRTGTVLDADQPVGASGLMSGDDVVVGPPPPMTRVATIPVRAVTLGVVAGPDTGTSVILLQGRSGSGAKGLRCSSPTRRCPATTSMSRLPRIGASRCILVPVSRTPSD